MNECEDISKISAFHDGELPPDEAHSIDQHIASCDRCADELRSLREMSGALMTVYRPPLEPAGRERIFESLHSLNDRSLARFARALSAVAAMVLISAGAIWIASPAPSPADGSIASSSWEGAASGQSEPVSTVVQSQARPEQAEVQTAEWIVSNLSNERSR